MKKPSVKKLQALNLSKPPKKRKARVSRRDYTGAGRMFGTGETYYEHGTLTYMDDGNGNVWDASIDGYGDEDDYDGHF